jgi:hypothetical protein
VQAIEDEILGNSKDVGEKEKSQTKNKKSGKLDISGYKQNR